MREGEEVRKGCAESVLVTSIVSMYTNQIELRKSRNSACMNRSPMRPLSMPVRARSYNYEASEFVYVALGLGSHIGTMHDRLRMHADNR